jgi:DNA polymerase
VSPRRPDAVAVDVAARAAAPLDLRALAHVVTACTACPLASGRRHVVVGDFPPGARLLLVGEGPGAQEDAEGRPFVGRAGRLLDRLLEQAGGRREHIAVANVVKCRPPGNRTPTRLEAVRCQGWLDRQVELADPDVVVTLGGTATGWALGPSTRIADVRGAVRDWRGRRLVATYHPSAALRFGPNGAPMAALRDDLRLALRAVG